MGDLGLYGLLRIGIFLKSRFFGFDISCEERYGVLMGVGFLRRLLRGWRNGLGGIRNLSLYVFLPL